MGIQDDLIGNWHLSDFFVIHADGHEVPWQGDKEGTLSYTADGRVSAYLKRETQPEETGTDKPAAMSYKGTYSFQDGRTVVHKIETSSDKDRIGKGLTRNFELQDPNTLIITGENKHNKFRIIWKREIS